MELLDLEDFLLSNGYADSTMQRYRRAIQLAQTNLGDLKMMTAQIFRDWLFSKGWGTSMRWINYIAVRQFLKWKYGSRHKALTLKIRRHKSGPQRTLTIPQALQLLSVFDTRIPVGVRDLAICALFLETGLRCAEMCRLRVRDIDLDHNRLVVQVKGGDIKSGVYCDYVKLLLLNWLEIRSKFAQLNMTEVFCSIGGTRPGTPFTRHGLSCNVRKWGLKARIGKLSPHDLRRTFATVATLSGAPERVLMEAGRWSNSDMIKTYTQAINIEAAREYSPVLHIMKQ